jgi:hypothetical protein
MAAGLLAAPVVAWFLKATVIAIIVRVILAMGITIAVYTGIGTGLNFLENAVFDTIETVGLGLPQLIPLLKIYGIYEYIQMVFSAFLGVVILKGAGGTIRQLRWWS